MTRYAKLFEHIVRSTIWGESLQTKIVWITMLAIKDKNGEVMGSIPGLAKLAGVSNEECEEALERLMAPDKYSRTKEFDGRRIMEIDGGWVILNAAKYSRMKSMEDEREKTAVRVQRFRDQQKGDVASIHVTDVTPCNAEKRHIDVDVDVDVEKSINTNTRKRRGPKGIVISGVDPKIQQIIKSLGPIWHRKQPDGSRINISNGAWIGSLNAILGENPDLDAGMLVEGAKIYLSEQRKMFKAPQYYFGPNGYWLDYANLAFERANAKKSEGGAE